MIQTFTLQPADLLRMRSGPPMEIQYGDTKLVFLDPKRLRAGESKAVVKINALHHSKATVNRVLTAAQLVAAPEPEKKKA